MSVGYIKLYCEGFKDQSKANNLKQLNNYTGFFTGLVKIVKCCGSGLMIRQQPLEAQILALKHILLKQIEKKFHCYPLNI